VERELVKIKIDSSFDFQFKMKLILALVLVAILVIADAANLGKNAIIPKKLNSGNDRWGDVPANRIKTCVYSGSDSGCTAPLVCIRSYAAQCVNIIDGTSLITFLNGTAIGSATVYFYPSTDCTDQAITGTNQVAVRTCAQLTNPNTAGAGASAPYVQVFTYGSF